MSTLRIVSAKVLAHFNKAMEGPACRIDYHLLNSAIARPESKYKYAGVRDPATLAASMAYGIIKKHPFANANKRTTLLAANSQLKLVGLQLQDSLSSPEDNKVLVTANPKVAQGEMEEEELAEVYKAVQKESVGTTFVGEEESARLLFADSLE